MSSPATGLRVASVVFALFALAHLVRIIKHLHVTVADHRVPMSVSVVGLVLGGILSIWMWRLSSTGRQVR